MLYITDFQAMNAMQISLELSELSFIFVTNCYSTLTRCTECTKMSCALSEDALRRRLLSCTVLKLYTTGAPCSPWLHSKESKDFKIVFEHIVIVNTKIIITKIFQNLNEYLTEKLLYSDSNI